MSEGILQLRSVSKSIGGKVILKNVNFTLNKGEIVTFIGSNGMGKSTILKAIAGFVSFSSGERILLDKNLKISYIPEHFPNSNFTVNEYLYHMGSILGMKKESIRIKVNKMYDIFNMRNMIDTKIVNLSKGSKQKVSVIQALMKKSELIIMDEPLSGQDLKSQSTFIDLIKELKKEKVTILLACHEMYLVESIGDRIVRIEGGEIIENNLKVESKDQDDLMLLNLNNINRYNINFLKELNGIVNIEEEENIINVVVKEAYSDNVIYEALKNKLSIIKLNKIER